MPGLHELTVSLTKNGYFKVAEVIKSYPKDEVLNKIDGNNGRPKLDRAQIANMLSADANDILPDVWDDIRTFGPQPTEALTFISIIFSHYKLIEMLAGSKISEMRGILMRSSIDPKTYTNLVDSMFKMGLGKKTSGADRFAYDLTPLFRSMSIGPLAKKLLKLKLEKTGWTEPDPSNPGDMFKRTFYEQCSDYGFHGVLGITEKQFEDWLEGRAVDLAEPPVIGQCTTMVKVSASLIAALAAKNFAIMTGPTGTGKTRTIRHLASSLCPDGVESGFNHVFIPVEAGWTDGRHLLGYRNPFGQRGESYTSTALISLLLRANYPKFANIPFFVILDEMNLSYVEMYFSRFLSLMETTEHDPEPVLSEEDLELLYSSGPATAVEAAYIRSAIDAHGLYLTRNVYIVGTVNMDETTHMFSPKVLDRAFVIEVPTIRPSAKPKDFDIADEDAANGEASVFWDYLTSTRLIRPFNRCDNYLDDLYDRLGSFAFGPRVCNESQRYMTSVLALRGRKGITCYHDFPRRKNVIDRLIMQKILPKLHGDRSQLRPTVKELKKYCEAHGFARSLAKLKVMDAKLTDPGFANFFAQQ